jgi:hypothetical protein
MDSGGKLLRSTQPAESGMIEGGNEVSEPCSPRQPSAWNITRERDCRGVGAFFSQVASPLLQQLGLAVVRETASV